MQVYEGGSAFMIESGYATPVQTYIDEEQFDMSDILPIIRNYYTYNGTMYSMPFNSSNAVLYYNKDMFRAAGLDPTPPATFAEMGEYAKALQTDEVAGVALPIDCSLFEFNMVNIGKEIVDNGNGHGPRHPRGVQRKRRRPGCSRRITGCTRRAPRPTLAPIPCRRSWARKRP